MFRWSFSKQHVLLWCFVFVCLLLFGYIVNFCLYFVISVLFFVNDSVLFMCVVCWLPNLSSSRIWMRIWFPGCTLFIFLILFLCFYWFLITVEQYNRDILLILLSGKVTYCNSYSYSAAELYFTGGRYPHGKYRDASLRRSPVWSVS